MGQNAPFSGPGYRRKWLQVKATQNMMRVVFLSVTLRTPQKGLGLGANERKPGKRCWPEQAQNS